VVEWGVGEWEGGDMKMVRCYDMALDIWYTVWDRVYIRESDTL